MFIGSQGDGQLDITAGGMVSCEKAYVSYQAMSSGLVNVDGAGSAWIIDSDLRVNSQGISSMNITGGGNVFCGEAYIGGRNWEQSMVSVEGDGSNLSIDADLYVDGSQSGYINISNGGSVSCRSGYLGFEAGLTGNATVAGTGSNLDIKALYAGKFGEGILSITDGGNASSGVGYIAYESGSSGAVFIGGSNSNLTLDSILWVGFSGSGELGILEGGTLYGEKVFVGNNAESSGMVTVDGTDSLLSVDTELILNKGTLSIVNGAMVEAADKTYCGSEGQIHFDNGTLNTRILEANVAGLGGTGTINVNVLRSGLGNLDILFDNPGLSSCVVTLDEQPDRNITINYTPTDQDDMFVGYDGSGSLTIQNGATVSSNIAYLSFLTGGCGAATIDGIDTEWNVSSTLQVGRYGSASLDITGGATVTSNIGNLGNSSSTKGMGAVTIDGAGSTWEVNDYLSVYKGELNISNGGVLDVKGATFVSGANHPSAIHFNNGTLVTQGLITDKSSLTGTGTIHTEGLVSNIDLLFDATHGATQTLTFNELPGQNVTLHLSQSEHGDLGVGFLGNSVLTIREGAAIASKNGFLGCFSDETGTAVVSGAGSTWTVNSYLNVGYGSNGLIRISDGGNVSCWVGQIGLFRETGTVKVDGPGSTLNVSGFLYIGDRSARSENSGVGVLEITNEALVSVDGYLSFPRFYEGDSQINMSTGGMLALTGEADESLDNFLALISGYKAINFWNNIYDDWSDITEGMAGLDYMLEYVDDSQSDLFGYTVLTVLTAPEPILGDADRDGDVDEADAAVLAVNWQMNSGASWYDGDFNGDGKVNDVDATLLAANWQAPDDGSTSIPEPSTLSGLLGLCLVGFLGWGRHR